MYHVIRCGGCTHLMTAQDNRHHILCPVCGVTSSVQETRIYVSCNSRETAEDIATQISRIIAKRRGRDLNDEEVLMLRHRYAVWERQNDCE